MRNLWSSSHVDHCIVVVVMQSPSKTVEIRSFLECKVLCKSEL